MKKEEKTILLESCQSILEYYRCRLEYFERKKKEAENLDKLIMQTRNDITKYELMLKNINDRRISH